ncbi:hypothetical protein [Mangrovibacillus cuniculi]|uniref:GAF domain-containing protein n=1 Tax=Mangrovibacillus cuniculi TaxID=2593652 RepID=A0A7S8HGS6_9BACI|nr:hypothetical protein [Mangrovibacillus cuniculi]QPC47735.1 hypothetical protein G8O30_12590 [Mangrovibacillus cuniculi]
MFKQNKHWIKWIELVTIAFVLTLFTYMISLDEIVNVSIFSTFILLIAIRYGILLGISAATWSVIQLFLTQVKAGNDVFLFVTFGPFWVTVIFYFVIAYVGGLYATRYKERYEDKEAERREVAIQLQQAVATLQTVHETNSILEKKVLTTETTINSVYRMLRSLDQENVESFTNNVAEILENYYGAKNYGIYHVDQNERVLRLKLKNGELTQLPTTIFTDQSPSFYQRMSSTGNITMRNISEEEKNAPLLAIPLRYDYSLKQVIIINDMDISSLSREGVLILQHVQSIMEDYLRKITRKEEQEREQHFYHNTSICKPAYFKKRVEIEKERWEKFGIAYSYFRLEAKKIDELILSDLDQALRPYLREVDILGYFPQREWIVVLLPATSKEHINIIQTRIQHVVGELMVVHD